MAWYSVAFKTRHLKYVSHVRYFPSCYFCPCRVRSNSLLTIWTPRKGWLISFHFVVFRGKNVMCGRMRSRAVDDFNLSKSYHFCLFHILSRPFPVLFVSVGNWPLMISYYALSHVDFNMLDRINLMKTSGVCRTERQLLPHNVKCHLFWFFAL